MIMGYQNTFKHSENIKNTIQFSIHISKSKVTTDFIKCKAIAYISDHRIS